MKNTRAIEPIALSIEEVGKATGLGRTALYKEMQEGRLRSYKIGRRRFVAPEALQEWAHAHQSAAA
ncbi:MAG: helix-turn-helix domain-containing protein [Chromatiaceae bacterium]|nr:helix-turn-helix domain-containing protein [Chromatiaceae bacterium]